MTDNKTIPHFLNNKKNLILNKINIYPQKTQILKINVVHLKLYTNRLGYTCKWSPTLNKDEKNEWLI